MDRVTVARLDLPFLHILWLVTKVWLAVLLLSGLTGLIGLGVATATTAALWRAEPALAPPPAPSVIAPRPVSGPEACDEELRQTLDWQAYTRCMEAMPP